jgi:hypothetical protein
MTKQEAIEKAGSVQALANLLRISREAIYQWTEIPESRLWQLKVLKPSWFRK